MQGLSMGMVQILTDLHREQERRAKKAKKRAKKARAKRS